MSAEAVFSSEAPEVLAVWDDWVKQTEEFAEFCNGIRSQWHREVYRSVGSGSRRVIGLEPTHDDLSWNATLPAGLRLDRRTHPWMLVPAKRTPRGKEVAQEWSAVRVAAKPYPGMPREVDSEGSEGFTTVVHWPGFTAFGREVWAVWGTSAERVAGDIVGKYGRKAEGYDATLWQQRYLADYYALLRDREISQKAAS